MKDLDVLMLALLALSDDELHECFLKAFHRLPAGEQVLVEDVGLGIMRVAQLARAEDALESVAKLGMHLHLGAPRLVVHRQ